MHKSDSFRKYTPSIPLSEFVDYLFVETEPNTERWVNDFIVPTHPRMLLTIPANKTIDNEYGLIKGIHSIPCQIPMRDDKNISIGVRFKPYGLYSGFGLAGDRISNDIVPCSMLFNEEINSFFGSVKKDYELSALIQLLNDILYSILQPKEILLEITEMIDSLVLCDLSKDNQKHLAKVFERSPKSFIDIFKKATGFTPLKYLHIHKVEQAQAMITHVETISFTDIAVTLGFYDQPHFIRIFKQHTGYTPSQFRNRYLKNDR